MKILIVGYTTRNYLGGAESYLKYLEEGLKERGVPVKSILLNDAVSSFKWKITKILALIKSYGSYDRYCVSVVKSFMTFLARATEKVVEEFKPDLIHTQDVTATAAISFIAKEKNIPIIMTDHGVLKPEGKLYQNLIAENEKKTFESVSAVICIAEHMRNLLLSKNPKINSFLVHNAIDLDKFLQSGHGENIFLKRPYILVVARLISYKGIDIAILAFDRVLQEYPHFHLVLAGHGPLFIKLKNLTKSLGIENRVHFLGGVAREKIPILYRDASVVWIPSKSDGKTTEAFSIVSLEAMAFSKPIVATNEGGPSEIFKEGGAVLVPAGDFKALADATIELIKNPEMAKQIGEVANKIVREKYNVAQWINKMITVYQETLNRKNV